MKKDDNEADDTLWAWVLGMVIGVLTATVLFATTGRDTRTRIDAACIRQYQAAATRADTLTIALKDQSCKNLLAAVEGGNK